MNVGSVIHFDGELGEHVSDALEDCPGRQFRVLRGPTEHLPCAEVKCETCHGTYPVVEDLFLDAVFSADAQSPEYQYAVKFSYRFHLGKANSERESFGFWFRTDRGSREFFSNVRDNVVLNHWHPNHPSEVLDRVAVKLYHKPDEGDWERINIREIAV